MKSKHSEGHLILRENNEHSVRENDILRNFVFRTFRLILLG
jgi:hypothetical protein